MKKRIVPVAVLAVLGVIVPAADSSAAVRAADGCTRSAVQAAVDSADSGDTVVVPAGTCTWTAAVTIQDKTITLKGAGSGPGGTRIVHDGGDHPLIDVNAGSKTGRMDISGFWFHGAASSNNWTGAAMRLWGPAGWKNLRVHHNVFDGNHPWTIRAADFTHGLIDHNLFKGRAYGILFYGQGAKDWATPLKLGTADFFFVENNTFDWDDFVGVTGVETLDMNNGGRVVFRNNSLINGYWQTHDKARTGMASGNGYEVYANTFQTRTRKWKAIDVSAGSGVIWGNDLAGDWMVPIGAMDYKSFDPRGVRRCDGSDPADQNVPGQKGWRCQYQIGSQGEGPSAYGYPLYLWSNRMNRTLATMQCTAGCSHVQAGRDYIDNGTTPKPGYRPYVYPHPLSQASATTLQPPSHVAVEEPAAGLGMPAGSGTTAGAGTGPGAESGTAASSGSHAARKRKWRKWWRA